MANEDENLGGNEPEEGECTNSDSDDIITNTHDISTDSESDRENEQGLLLFIIVYCLSYIFAFFLRCFCVYNYKLYMYIVFFK